MTQRRRFCNWHGPFSDNNEFLLMKQTRIIGGNRPNKPQYFCGAKDEKVI